MPIPPLSRLAAGVVSLIMLVSPFGIGKGNNTAAPAQKSLRIEVSADSMYTTIEEARDYIRTLDKSKYSDITVNVKGEYTVSSPIEFTAEDSGTEKCPITYAGEDGTKIIGGVRLSAKDFKKSEGGLTKYFPEEVREKIVMVDLKPYGISAERMEKAFDTIVYLNTVPFLSVNGTRQMLAQYPNDWMHIGEVVTHSADGSTDTAIDLKTIQTVNYGEEHAEFVQSWSEAEKVYIRGRFFKLWCPDDSRVVSISKEEPTVDILFGGGHQPFVGTIMYFYNVPEALDIPGEYIIDSNAVLYYYPTEDFDTATVSLPVSKNIMTVTDAEYLTFKNIMFTSSYANGVVASGNYLTFDGCEISSIVDRGLVLNGTHNKYINGSVHDIGYHAVCIDADDIVTLTGGDVLFYNNEVYDYSMSNAYGYGIDVSGYGVTVSHNEVHDAGFKGIHFAGAANCVAEYNDCYRLLLLCDDVGALSIDSRNNANIVFRYNYIHEIGPVGEAANIRAYNPDYEYYGADAFYHDGGSSYVEMYGNVINGCDDGYRSNAGRCNSFHDNIVMNCRMWYCLFVETEAIDSYLDNGKNAKTTLPDYVFSDVWKELNPDFKTLKLSTEGTEKFDPTVWCSPAHLEAYDNYIFYNKVDRYFTNWGVKPYSLEKYILDYNPDSIEPAETNMMIYSSARNPLTAEEAVEIAQDVTGITPEIFASIGRITR